jgi:hypothetical protein
LLGGWRIAQDFPRGCIAIDFSRMKLWMGGHAQRQEVMEYNLPAMGSGANVDAWPRVDPVRTIPGWWQGGYALGLIFWRNKLWVSPRLFYATGGLQNELLTLYAEDGETIATSLVRQKFSGFVKRGPGLDPLLGCGGSESGQGINPGPSLATVGGQRLIEYGWPASPGANLEHWNERAPRQPNYRPLRSGTFGANAVPEDSWVGWIPRTVNGQLQGRWACDRIFSGGLVLPEGVTYWPWMGTGDLDYALQSYTMAPDDQNRTYAYRYDGSTYQLLGYEACPEFGNNPVFGQELDSAGRVYLAHGNQWQSTTYRVDVALRVFG